MGAGSAHAPGSQHPGMGAPGALNGVREVPVLPGPAAVCRLCCSGCMSGCSSSELCLSHGAQAPYLSKPAHASLAGGQGNLHRLCKGWPQLGHSPFFWLGDGGEQSAELLCAVAAPQRPQPGLCLPRETLNPPAPLLRGTSRQCSGLLFFPCPSAVGDFCSPGARALLS